jgi:hypothetical protein
MKSTRSKEPFSPIRKFNKVFLNCSGKVKSLWMNKGVFDLARVYNCENRFIKLKYMKFSK